jgi:hypothetical protein
MEDRGIFIDRTVQMERRVEAAIETILWNADAKLVGAWTLRFVALLAWTTGRTLWNASIEPTIPCLDALHAMVPKPFEMGQMLPLSKTIPRFPGSFMLAEDRDWEVLNDAVRIIKQSRCWGTKCALEKL